MILLFLIIIPVVLAVAVGISIVAVIVVFNNKKKTASDDYYSKSRIVKEGLGSKLRKLFQGKVLDEAGLEELEEVLLKADIGPRVTYDLIEKLRSKKSRNIDDAIELLKEELNNILFDSDVKIKNGELNVLLVLGVNGVGKTTSIAKIANLYLSKGYKILLAAGDTFRAAAVQQLTKWANRLNVPIVKQHEGADPSSVVYDAIDSAKAKNVDVLLVDTAGRLHNKANLIEELKKIERVIAKKGDLIKQNILVIDATTGQNAFQQAESFNEAVGVDGLVMAKYDSGARGGIVINIQKKLKIPFFYMGTGEKIDNIKEFKKDEFIKNIFA